MKNPLSVRKRFPFESNVVTQITEGCTFAWRFPNSEDGVCAGLIAGDSLTGEAGGDCTAVLTGGGECDCCANNDSPLTCIAYPKSKAAMQNRLGRTNRICLITIWGSVKYARQRDQVYKLRIRNDGSPAVAFFPPIRKPSLLEAKQPRLTSFEILDGAFVLLRCSLAVEGTEIFPFARSRIFLARIKPILARFQFPDHNRPLKCTFIFCSFPLIFANAGTFARRILAGDPGSRKRCPTDALSTDSQS